MDYTFRCRVQSVVFGEGGEMKLALQSLQKHHQADTVIAEHLRKGSS